MDTIAPRDGQAVGQDADHRCPHCQAANRPGARFCTRCGQSLRAGRIPLAAAGGERKLVTVMFADISGFTARSEHLDPEEVVTMMNACFVELDKAVSRYEGTIDKFIGDAMMVLFGAPAAHENDAERAVRCALEMQARLAAFSATQPGGDSGAQRPLALHIGINTGLVVAGEIGTPRRRDYTVMGDAVNLASRLESAATAGQILIGAGTHRLVEQLFQCRPLPPLALKGKSEPQQAYEVVGVTEAVSARGFERAGVRALLLGRDRELDLLSNAVQALDAGQGGLGCIVAEAGLGKSRLTAELRDRVGNRVTWVEARSLAYGAAIPYHALQNAFRQLLDVPATLAPGEAVARIRKGLAAFGDGADATAPVLWPHVVALLGYPLPDDPAAARLTAMDSAARNGEFSWLLREHWRRVAEVRPTVLVFEDLHWADPATVGLVRDLLPVTREAPLLFLLLYRPENEGPLARLRPLAEGDPRARVLRLQPLNREQSTEMVRALLDRYHLPSELHARLLEKAEGNPFYLEEVSRALLDHGAVSTEGGLWVQVQVDELDVPDSLHGLIATRVDRLSPALKSTLQRAAVIGRHFSAAGLTALVDEPPILPSHLAELEGRELIKPGPATPAAEYAFKHALVQEVAYSSLLKEQRRLLHRVLADHLDPQHTEPGLLAYHYERAEEWPQALRWLTTAAEVAYAQYANATALDLVGRALAAWGEVYPADAPPDALRTKIALYELLAAVGTTMADRAAMQQAAAGLRETGAALDDARARVHGYLTATHLNHLESDWDAWEKNIATAHASAAASGDQDLISDVYVRQARLYTARLGPHAAIPYLRRSAAISYLIHDDRELTDSLNNLALAYQTTGETRRAAWHAAYALKLSLRLGDLRLTAGNYLSVGRIALLRGQLAAGLASMQAGQRDADRAGQARLQVITRDHVSMAYSAIGLYAQALEAAGEAGALIRRHGLDDLIGFNITTRADALIGQGRYDDARSALDEMRRRRSTGQLGQWMGPLLIRRSRIDWLDGRPAQARATLIAARAHLPHLPSDLLAYSLWAAASLGVGDLTDAQARIDQALTWLAQTGNELDAPFAYAVAARVYAALGRDDLFAAYVAQARSAIQRQWTALAHPRHQAAFAARWARRTAPLGLGDALTPVAES
ncbi:MAG TPA: adenylate/guanylate cyclase domain-containing protein [Chloroflexia bacterium]|nr:adenylate/guanylate cyclase domain-containing protein [Chloroflexia bacterium]